MFESEATIIWDIPKTQPSGTYKISYFLDHKELGGTIVPANGTSKPFTVTAGAKVNTEAEVIPLNSVPMKQLQPNFGKPEETKMEKYLRKISKINRQNENDVLKGKGRNPIEEYFGKNQG